MEIQSAAERAAFLDRSCGEDLKLRAQLERLLQSNEQAGSFLEKRPTEPEATILTDGSDGNLAAALDGGLAAAFSAEQVVVLGDGNHSVLKMLGQTLDKVPRVALREPVEEGAEPIVKPKSAEMPRHDSDSRYRLDGEIARGGMGAILKGRDTDLGRDLAIKVLLDQHKDKPEVVQRFVEEAQIGGQLQHPGIAPIYELGQFADKRPFFAMKLVKGETLSKLLGDRTDPAEERARFIGILEQICQTMAYAHSRGVIHRDLKPANIMVGAFGEVQVMDWGLAKVLANGGIADEKKAHDKHQDLSVVQTMRRGPGSGVNGTFGTVGSQTQMGSVMGTPAYMPPEQALGEIDNLDERADVFGLGAILCEILTGKPPYVADDGTRVFRMASRGKLEDCFQRLDDCGADAELIALTKHCMEIEPSARPRHAGVLAELVTRYIESVETRLRKAEVDRAAEAARAEEALHTVAETEARTRAERRARRMQLAMAAVVAVVATIGGLAAVWTASEQIRLRKDALMAERDANSAREKEAGQRVSAEAAKARAAEQKLRAEMEKSRAEVAQRQADAEKIRSLNMLADMQTERGLQSAREGQSAAAALWFANAAAITPHDPDRWQANYLRASSWMDQAITPAALLKLPDGPAQRFAFQPNGPLLLTVSGNKLRVWDWRYEVVLPWSETLAAVTDAVWSPDGKQMAVGFGTADVKIFDPISGNELKRFQHSERVAVVEWSPDKNRLAVAGLQVQIWNIVDEPALESNWPHPQNVFALRFNRAGTRLLTSCNDDQARMFAVGDASLPVPLYAPVDHAPEFQSRWGAAVFFDDDRQQKFVTISSQKKQPELRDAATGLPVEPGWVLTHQPDRGPSVSPDGRWVAVGDPALLLNAQGQRIELKHFNHIQTMSFTPDSAALVTTCFDGIARWWPLHGLSHPSPSAGEPITFPQMATSAECQISPDGSSFAIFTNQQLVVWERQQSSPVVSQISWPESFWRARVSFDGRLVTPGAWHESPIKAIPRSNTLRVARMVDGAPAGALITLDGLLLDSCVCTDNRTVAAATAQGLTGILTFYNIASGTMSLPPLTLPDVPVSVAARPGHPQLAVLCRNGQLLIVSTENGKSEREHSHAEWFEYSQATRVAFSPDGATLVSVTPTHRVYVWDLQTEKLRFPPLQPVADTCYIRSIAFSPDSRRLATAVNGRNMVQVWDLMTGDQSGKGMPHPGDFFGLFSVAFSPDGQRILTGHKDGRGRIWDWKSGELVGAPMQHPDEVLDAQFTPDGRHILTAVRLHTLHVWDAATNKLAVPLPENLALPGESTNTLTVSGNRIVVGATTRNPVLDLSQLIQSPTVELATLLTHAELATNQKLQNGELVPLESHEWSTRWEQLVAARQTPEQRIDSLAQAWDDAADPPAQNLIIARATRRGLLERLQALRPNSLPLSLALTLEWSRQGRKSDVEQLRGEMLGQVREIAANGPVDPGLMSTLTQLLIEDIPRGTWRRLEAFSMKGAEETTFTHEPNGFILAGIGNARPDTYSIEGRAAVKRIAALRLDVAPHALLPSGGSGYGAGNFHLVEVRARVLRADGTETALKLSRAAADYVRPLEENDHQANGPWGVLDGDPQTHWDLWPIPAQPHWLVLIPEEPCDLGENDTLIVELDSGDQSWPFARLGHFRLSVSEDLRADLSDELIAAVGQHELDADEMFAAACLMSGEAAIALKVLEHAPETEERDKLLRAMLVATAQRRLGQHDVAQKTVKAVLTESPPDPWPHSLTGFYLRSLRDFADLSSDDVIRLRESRAAELVSHRLEREFVRLTTMIEENPNDAANVEARANVLMRLGRWNEAANDWTALRKQTPDRRSAWFIEANCRLIAGEDTSYRQLCLDMVEQFRGTTDAQIADSVTKTCLLRPGTIGQSELPLQLLRNAIHDPTYAGFHRWFVGSSALASYREGKFDEAITWVAKEPDHIQHSGALALVVRAMAEHQLGQHDQARQTLDEVEALIPKSLRNVGAPQSLPERPTPADDIASDWLTPELLRREAAAMIR
ncbi:MAG: protein kinase domain-containing protein [Planctomycetota bacterium]